MKSYSWLEVLNPQVVTGKTRCAMFDFDGTISVIRRGWEEIMISLMVEMIADGKPLPAEIKAEVVAYVDHSTGLMTIKQMEWLEDAVRRYGLSSHPLSASEYKQFYTERLLKPMRQRIAALEGHSNGRDDLMIAGVRAFMEGLTERGVQLFLASGTDHEVLITETRLLHVADFFGDRMYGAKGDLQPDSKEKIIARILKENNLRSEELLVIGDGPVEIRNARQVGAVALGVTADEETRQTLNPHKRTRLAAAGADLLVSNFLPAAELVSLFCG
jgi:phosphoglycolate phosphatase-like HAD superfamily hydrolase